MKYFKKGITAILIFAIVSLHPSIDAFSQEKDSRESADVTIHSIESRSTSDQQISSEAPKKSSWLLWGLLGAVVIGGGAAALSGGGDDSSGGSNGTIPEGGSATISW